MSLLLLRVLPYIPRFFPKTIYRTLVPVRVGRTISAILLIRVTISPLFAQNLLLYILAQLSESQTCTLNTEKWLNAMFRGVLVERQVRLFAECFCSRPFASGFSQVLICVETDMP